MGDVKRVKMKDGGSELLLPEEVISNILSRLNTREAGRTSVLSKHWRNCWTNVRSLNFCPTITYPWLALDKFVPQVLRRRQPWGLSKLSVLFNGQVKGQVKEEIISLVYNYAISHQIEELDTDDIGSFQIPSLKTLRLTYGRISDLHGFTSLTVLKLRKVTFLDPSRDDIFSYCLNLEKLVMVECRIEGLGGLCISSPRLISLQIQQDLREQYYVVIKSPQLELCELDFNRPTNLKIDDCPALDNVNIDISFIDLKPWSMMEPEFVNIGFCTVCDVPSQSKIQVGFSAYCDVKLSYSDKIFSSDLVQMCEEMSYARLLTMWFTSAGGSGSRLLYKHDAAAAVPNSEITAHMFAETLSAPDVLSRWRKYIIL